MQKNKTLGPTTYPKRHLFLDIDNVVEWDLNVFQNFPKPERVETTGLECGPPKSWDARVAAGWGTVLYDESRFRGWVCCMPGIGSLKENCDVWLTGYVEIGPRQGDALTINALTRHRGLARVAIAEQRNPLHLELRKSDSLPGFSFDDCIPFSGDAVKAPVHFRKAKIADLPKDKFLILRFEVSSGEVFGYEWA